MIAWRRQIADRKATMKKGNKKIVHKINGRVLSRKTAHWTSINHKSILFSHSVVRSMNVTSDARRCDVHTRSTFSNDNDNKIRSANISVRWQQGCINMPHYIVRWIWRTCIRNGSSLLRHHIVLHYCFYHYFSPFLWLWLFHSIQSLSTWCHGQPLLLCCEFNSRPGQASVHLCTSYKRRIWIIVFHIVKILLSPIRSWILDAIRAMKTHARKIVCTFPNPLHQSFQQRGRESRWLHKYENGH